MSLWSKGCLEMYASEFYFRNRGEELKEAYPTSELKDFHFDKVAKVLELETKWRRNLWVKWVNI